MKMLRGGEQIVQMQHAHRDTVCISSVQVLHVSAQDKYLYVTETLI